MTNYSPEFIAQQGAGRPSKGDRTRSNIAFNSLQDWMAKQLGNGKRQAGVDTLPELARLLSEAYPHCPDELQTQIEDLGVVEVVDAAPDEFAERDDKGNVAAWIF